MVSEKLDEKAIFNVARKIDSPDARAEYLHQVCGADQNLFERVDTLLSAYEVQASFLDRPAIADDATIHHEPSITERPGTVIGPYKLLQQIGEGGMGVVFMAVQSEPIQRTVALKIIKPGMDTRQVIARFEAERQALAMMDHPNIAKVLDAGATDSGRPYFVMELVKGVPITKYCDEKHLSLRARLELLLPVCQAVQHAHQKGVIHRDIKPTNVLVAEYDDHAVPKVIDFGVAKATATKLTDLTMFTEFGQVVGTVEYMSPEQAKLNQLDIDTRSDIYSLGVLLYELLTGSTPFGRKRLQSAAFDEMLRIIREEEPAKPSTRLSTTVELASIAASRSSEPKKLSGLVEGELDWIVMKALEKDRNRRYETANGFAADIQRYLHDEAIEAGPPSRIYRMKKFIRRNRGGVFAASAIVVALTLGLALSGWMFLRERQAYLRAVAAEHEEARLRHEAEAGDRVSRASLLVSRQKFDEADALIDKISASIEPSLDGAALFRALGDWHAKRGEWRQATARFATLMRLDESHGWYSITIDYSRIAPAVFELGDMAEYSRFRRQAAVRFAGEREPRAAERIIKICLLSDANEELLAALVGLRSHAGIVDPTNTIATPWAWVSYALLDYRRAEYVQSIEWCRKILAYDPSESQPPRNATAHIVLALSLHQLHQEDDARAELAVGRAAIEEQYKRELAGSAGWTGYWFDWTIATILLREAVEVIDRSAAVKQPPPSINPQPSTDEVRKSSNPTQVPPPTTNN